MFIIVYFIFVIVSFFIYNCVFYFYIYFIFCCNLMSGQEIVMEILTITRNTSCRLSSELDLKWV